MSRPRRKFDKEFKIEAVKMVLDEGLSKAEVSRKLDITQGMIGKWVQDYKDDEADAFPGQGNLKPEDDEVRKLKRENRQLKEELEFLKKSAAYFASLKK